MEKICYVSDTIEGGGSAVDSYKKQEMRNVWSRFMNVLSLWLPSRLC